MRGLSCWSIVLAAGISASGCYLTHELDDPGPVVELILHCPEATVVPAGPEDRPSDLGADWIDLPAPSGSRLLEPSAREVLGTIEGDEPTLSCDATGYLVLASGRVHVLDTHGRTRAAPIPLDRGGGGGIAAQGSRWVVAADAVFADTFGAALYSEAGRTSPAWSPGEPPQGSPQVAYLAHGQRWIVGALRTEASATQVVNLVSYEDDLAGAELAVTASVEALSSARLLSFRSRVATVVGSGSIGFGAEVRMFRGPVLSRVLLPGFIGTRSAAGFPRRDVSPGAARFRDLAAVIYPAARGAVVLGVAGVFEAIERDGVFVGEGAAADRRPALASADELGFMVGCWITAPEVAGRREAASGDDGIALQVVGADLEPWGEPLVLARGEANIASVACAWSGEEVVVVWSRDTPSGREMISESVRPTFLP